METRTGEARPGDVVTPRVPFNPANPNHVTLEEFERMIDSRIQLAFAAQQEQEAAKSVYNRQRENYRAVAFGVGGLAVGTLGTLGISALVRRSRARRGMTGPNK